MKQTESRRSEPTLAQVRTNLIEPNGELADLTLTRWEMTGAGNELRQLWKEAVGEDLTP